MKLSLYYLVNYVVVFVVVPIIEVISHPASVNLNLNISHVSNLILNTYEANGLKVDDSRKEMSNSWTPEQIPPQQSPCITLPERPRIPKDAYGNVDTLYFLTPDEKEKLKEGVELNPDYNETRSNHDHPEKLISSPGCPPSGMKVGLIKHPHNRDTFVHFGDPPRCFLVGTQGLCPEGMRIGHQKNSSTGVCKCSCYFHVDEDTFNYRTNLYEDLIDPFKDLKQKFCYSAARSRHFANYEGKCYELYTQGPCNPDEVLVPDTEGMDPVCKKRECPEPGLERMGSTKQDNEVGYRFLFNGSCTEFGGSCEGSVSKGSVQLTKYNPHPTCQNSSTSRDYGGTILNNDCPIYQYYYESRDECRSRVHWLRWGSVG